MPAPPIAEVITLSDDDRAALATLWAAIERSQDRVEDREAALAAITTEAAHPTAQAELQEARQAYFSRLAALINPQFATAEEARRQAEAHEREVSAVAGSIASRLTSARQTAAALRRRREDLVNEQQQRFERVR